MSTQQWAHAMALLPSQAGDPPGSVRYANSWGSQANGMPDPYIFVRGAGHVRQRARIQLNTALLQWRDKRANGYWIETDRTEVGDNLEVAMQFVSGDCSSPLWPARLQLDVVC